MANQIMQRQLPLCRPSITQLETRAVLEVMQSGWLTTGAKALEFEERFRAFVGSDFAVAVTSGTAAMHVVFHGLNIGPGDEVITPSLTWVSTINLIELMGAKPVFVDVDRHNLMTSAEHIEKLITRRTKAIVPVHFAGAACDVDSINSLIGERQITLIEDTAHAVGTKFNEKQVGSKYNSVFSFHAIKNLTTGEGGMVCSNDQELVERIRRVKFHGLAVDAFDRVTQGRRPQAMVVEPGFKYNMTDMCAALGLVQLDRIFEINQKRCALAQHYQLRIAGIKGVDPLSVPDTTTHAWHLFIVRVTAEKHTREEVMSFLSARGIGSGIHFLPAHQHPYYLNKYGPHKHLKNSEWNGSRIMSLPLYPDMEMADVDHICDVLEEAVKP